MRDLLFIGFAFIVIIIGFTSPYIMGLGYLWFSIVEPQRISYTIFSSLPTSLIIGVMCIFCYLIFDRKNPPRLDSIVILTLAIALWGSMTLLWSVAPDRAFVKWDDVFKTLIFSAMVPYLFRSRHQIEALILFVIFSVGAHVTVAGIKTLGGGGGYGSIAFLSPVQQRMGESNSLALASVMIIPLVAWVRKHSIIFPKHKIISLAFLGLIILAIAAPVGTYSRGGLLSLVVLAIIGLLQTNRKFIYILGLIPVLAVFYYASPPEWKERMSTIGTYQADGSASQRVAVWEWTWNFVKSHPFGGGFESYIINEFTVETVIKQSEEEQTPGVISEPEKREKLKRGRAFHSMYFEVLGELGYFGLFLFLSLLAVTFAKLFKAKAICRSAPEGEWLADLAKAIILSLVVLMVGGAFIGVAYSAIHVWLIGVTVSIARLAKDVQKAKEDGTVGVAASPALA